LFMSLPEVVTDCTPQLCENHVGAPPPPLTYEKELESRE
jgi:hypothetical protein